MLRTCLDARSLRSRGPSERGLNLIRLVLLTTLVLGLARPGSGQGGSPATEGSWSPVIDWNCDTLSLEPANGPREKLMHGALIPHGPYRGCVLMWGQYANTTETFLWIPNDAQRLFRIPSLDVQLNPTFGRNVEGISLTWDDEGQLVVVGAAVQPPAPAPAPVSAETWRLFPAALHFPPIESVIVGNPPPPCNQWFAWVQGGA